MYRIHTSCFGCLPAMFTVAALSWPMVAACSGQGPRSTATDIHRAHQLLLRELTNCRIEYTVSRFESDPSPDSRSSVTAFLSADAMQRLIQERTSADGSARGRAKAPPSIDSPLNRQAVLDFCCIVQCARVRPAVEFALLDMREEAKYAGSSIYIKTSTPGTVSPSGMPYIDTNRRFYDPARTYNSLDNYLSQPLDAWTIAGEEVVNGLKCLALEIATQAPVPGFRTSTGEEVTLQPIFRILCAQDRGLLPVLAYGAGIYTVDGVDFRMLNPKISECWTLSDLQPVGDSWFPARIVHERFKSERNPIKHLDELVKSARQTSGRAEKSTLVSRTEFEITAIEKRGPMNDLWVDPPAASVISDNDASTILIEGLSEAESLARLGLEPGEFDIRERTSSRRSRVGMIIFFAVNVVIVLVILYRWRSRPGRVKS